MTKEQRDWLIKNNLDPEVYDIDAEGNVFENPIMGKLEAGARSAAASLVPAAGGFGAAALGAAAGAPLGPLGMISGGLIAGFGGSVAASKAQEAVLEKYSPETLQKLAQAQEEQPVASYAGGFLPTALTLRPTTKGLSGLLRPAARQTTLREAISKPEFIAPASNVAINVGQAAAGQALDVSQGAEFSGPRFAADVALGTLFSRPTRLGRKLGLPDIPEDAPVQQLDLDRARFMAQPPEEFVTPREERLGTETEQRNRPISEERTAKQDEDWWKSETEPTADFIKEKAARFKVDEFGNTIDALAKEPNANDVVQTPEQVSSFIQNKYGEALQSAYESISKINEIGNKLMRGLAEEQIGEAQRALARQKEAETLGFRDILPKANDAAQDIYSTVSRRLQRQGEGAKITQADIDAAAQIAARRNLKIELDRAFAGDREVRGMWLVNKDGDRVVRVNPLMATPDTAIHEIGHDIFSGVTNPSMRKSLLESAQDSPAYRSELAARQAEVDQGRLTQEQANNYALEEGLIQAFGEQAPSIKRSEIRSWFKAVKASTKQLFTGKISPEDAIAWLHYASTESVPWKGVAAPKAREERMQREQQETPEFKSFFGASKVVDATGKPKFVYHGTGADITQFEKGLLDKGALYGPGIYLTESADVAGGLKGYSFKGLKPDDSTAEFSFNENLPIVEQIKQAKEQAIKEGFTQEEVNESIFVPGDDATIYMHYQESWQQPNVMPLYAKIENPFDIDAIYPNNWGKIAEKMDETATRLFGDKYLGIDFDRLAMADAQDNIDGRSLYKALSRSFEIGEPGKSHANKVLQEMGYDGITHTGGLSQRYGSGKPHQVWIAFEPEQVKSALGNKGTFSPESPDIRYQRGEEQRGKADDASYLKAVEAGDTQAAQRMVDEAAKAAGYDTREFYRSVRRDSRGGELESRGESYVTNDRDAARKYKKGIKYALQKVYPKLGNILKLESKENLQSVLPKIDLSEFGYLFEALDNPSVRDQIWELGYDSVRFEDLAPDNRGEHTSWLLKDSGTIKSANPITRDDAGNVIPLSKRFQAESPDIRYQRGEEDATRRFAERVIASEEVPAEVRRRVAESPLINYKRQNVADAAQTASTLSDRQLTSDLLDAKSNTRVISSMELFNRAIRAGDFSGASEIAVSMAKEGTTWGQLINQFKLLKSATPEGVIQLVSKSLEQKKRKPMTQAQVTALTDAMNQYRAASDQVTAAKRAARDAIDANNEPAMQQAAKQFDLASAIQGEADVAMIQLIGRINPSSAADLFISMVQGAVMAPISITRNVVGNIINTPLRDVSDRLAAAIDSALFGGKNSSYNYRARSIERLNAFAKSLPQALKILLKGSDAMPYELSTDIGNPLNFTRAWRNLYEAMSGQYEGAPIARNIVEATLGAIPDVFLRLTQATDVPFRSAERARIITEVGRQRGLSKSQIELAKRDPKLLRITDEQAQKGRKGFTEDDLGLIEYEAAKAVFQQDNAATRMVSGINRFIKQEGGPVAYVPYRLISLFQKTPINVAAEALSFTPAGVLRNWKDMSVREREIATSRLIIGGIVTGAYAYLYDKGVITPNLDTPGETNKARELAKAGGVMPPGTLNVSGLRRLVRGESPTFQPGDTVKDLSALGTSGALGMMVGTAKRLQERSPTDDPDFFALGKGAALSGINFVMEQQFLKGTSDFIKLLSQESGSALDRFVKSLSVTAASPVAPAILGAVRRVERENLPAIGGEGFIKDTVNELNQRFAAIGLQIPGTRDPNAMPVRRDLWGEPVEQTPKSENPWIYNFFSAAKSRQIDADPLNATLYSIWRRTADNQVIPSAINPKITYKGTTFERMTPDQYDRYTQLVGFYRRKLAERAYLSGQFQQRGDEVRINMLKRVYDKGLEIGKYRFLKELRESGQSLTPQAGRRGFTAE